MLDLFAYKAYIASPHRSIKHTTYFQVYEQLFKPYRNKKITFVEVGVLDGGSLFMWRKFFGKKARIIGIDLNPEAKKWEKDVVTFIQATNRSFSEAQTGREV